MTVFSSNLSTNSLHSPNLWGGTTSSTLWPIDCASCQNSYCEFENLIAQFFCKFPSSYVNTMLDSHPIWIRFNVLHKLQLFFVLYVNFVNTIIVEASFLSQSSSTKQNNKNYQLHVELEVDYPRRIERIYWHFVSTVAFIQIWIVWKSFIFIFVNLIQVSINVISKITRMDWSVQIFLQSLTRNVIRNMKLYQNNEVSRDCCYNRHQQTVIYRKESRSCEMNFLIQKLQAELFNEQSLLSIFNVKLHFVKDQCCSHRLKIWKCLSELINFKILSTHRQVRQMTKCAKCQNVHNARQAIANANHQIDRHF